MRTDCWGLVFRAAWLSFAASLAAAAPSPVRNAEFAAGIQAYTEKDYASAVRHLTVALNELPSLSDYIAFHLASARGFLSDPAGAHRDLAIFRANRAVLSPLASKALLLDAQVLLRTNDPGAAIRILREGFEALPQPEGALELAQAYEAQGEKPQAAALYQRVYFTHPATQAAVAAAAALERLKAALGKDYPPPPPEQMLARGDTWLTLKSYAKAKAEYQALGSQLSGMARDQATVRMAASDYLAGDAPAARTALEKLHLAHSEADAERLYYLGEAARKLGDDVAMQNAVDQLGKHYADSPWRLKALISAGNRYLVSHDPAKYTPLFQTAYQKFAPDQTTANAHWRIAWDAYLKRAPEAQALLREQVSKYPKDTHAASALFFLGRLSEVAGDNGAGRSFYEALQRVFPNYYYGVLAAEKLKEAPLQSAAKPEEAERWLSTIDLPDRPDLNTDAPTAATKAHIERAHLLAASGFADWAQTELRFGADTDGQRHLLALEIAREDATPALALRHMKTLTPEYLSLPIERAPREFWRFLFPLPYREPLTQSAQAQGIDPYLLAGLIRQESEFNPGAVSHAHALGLTQMIPGTGRMMARGQGISGFQSGMLFQPETSLRLGSAYLKNQLNQWNGNLEQTLAAYNAGPGRVREWLAWSTYREQAEFVESIPFTETREYVQAVIRNAAIYKRLYAGRQEPEQVTNRALSAVTSKNAAVPHVASSFTAHKPRRTAVRNRRHQPVS